MALNIAQSLVNKATAKGNARKPEQNAARNSRNEVVVMLVIVVLHKYGVVARWGEEVQPAHLTMKCGIKLYIVVARRTKVTLRIIWGEVYLRHSIVLGLPRSAPRAEVINAVVKYFAAATTRYLSARCLTYLNHISCPLSIPAATSKLSRCSNASTSFFS